ncbi:hypothetical protein PspLS_01923 [Pyricularia sp. CBS 133598]|nr:hypothetical protein PspLS_01923 [Pyricularia sp. CBS 133598]
MSNTVLLSHDEAGFIYPLQSDETTRRKAHVKSSQALHVKGPSSTPHEQTSATSARGGGPVYSVKHIWTKGSVRLRHVPRPRHAWRFNGMTIPFFFNYFIFIFNLLAFTC